MMRRIWIAGCSAAVMTAGLVGLGAAGGPAEAQPSVLGSCAPEILQTVVPGDTVVVSAERLMKPVPHCKVEGFSTGTNPGPNRSWWRLQLPDKDLWKGRYYFIGLGGAAGYVPTDSQFPAGNPMVKGFAVAGTDTGHKGAPADWRFLSDPAKLLDHKHRGAHLTAVATQAITRAYYGAPKIYRYHTGCSGGGRMGSEAMTHHPEDFDGILLGERSGFSVNKRIEFSNYRFIYNSQQMNREPGAWVSPAKFKMLEAKITEACDTTDGAKDGIVWDHRLCKYDFNRIKCREGDGPDCLTQPEITSIRNILAGPHGPNGEKLAEGWPITNISNWAVFLGQVPPPWPRDPAGDKMDKTSTGYIIAYTRGSAIAGLDFDPMNVDLKDPKTLEMWETAARRLGFTEQPNPVAYGKTGGKVILWVGVSSQCCTSIEMEQWFDKYSKEIGPSAKNFMAMYEGPGIGHCMGGPGPEDGPDVVFQALVDWVENGKQPGGLIAHRGDKRVQLMFAENKDVPALPLELTGGKPLAKPMDTGVERDFLLCPYPQKSVFDKSKARIPGAVYAASHWSCK